MPAHSVWVRAIDLGMQIEENATNIPIVTLLVRTKSGGTTTIYISRLRIDDDFDRRINPIIENGSISVSTSGSSISGFITYACNETGLAGATVNLSLWQPGNGNGNETPAIKSTVTDSNGSYMFISVYPGTYNITASKRGFWSNFSSVTVTGAPASESYTLNLTLWLKGDLNNNGKPADDADVAKMKNASIGNISPDWRYDLNRNGIAADAGDLAMIKDASAGNIVLE